MVTMVVTMVMPQQQPVAMVIQQVAMVTPTLVMVILQFIMMILQFNMTILQILYNVMVWYSGFVADHRFVLVTHNTDILRYGTNFQAHPDITFVSMHLTYCMEGTQVTHTLTHSTPGPVYVHVILTESDNL